MQLNEDEMWGGAVNGERQDYVSWSSAISCCVHLKEKAPNVNMIYLWKVEIWITFSTYLYFLVFCKLTKLNGNHLFSRSSIWFSNLLSF